MNNYTTKTASLLAAKIKGTKADITYLNIDGTPFSKVISSNVPETPTENDIWKYAATTDDNGVVAITDDVTCDYSEMTEALKAITTTAIKVVDNKVLDANDTLLMNWDTSNFTNKNNRPLRSIFEGSYSTKAPLTTFTSDLSSLTNGDYMFYATSLESFDSDLSSLTFGARMFLRASSLTSFTSNLSSLTNGWNMFRETSLTSFTSNLSSLTDGRTMFYKAPLESFTSDLSSLVIGDSMFRLTSLTSFTSTLSSLTDGELMFYKTPLESFTLDLPSLINGELMFYKTSLASFDSDLSSLTDGSEMFSYCTSLASFDSPYLYSLTNGRFMFAYCTSLASFTSDLSSLTNGGNMFQDCTSLESFNSDLSSLINGWSMFNNCTSLESFNSDITSLDNGTWMFYNCTSLESFNSDLPTLANGYNMFAYCASLESFTSDLPTLVNGWNMFSYCTSLASFTADLSSLITGDGMFYKCKLDAQSVIFIIESIRDIKTEKASLTSSDYLPQTSGVYAKPFGWMTDGRYVHTYNKPEPYTTTIPHTITGKITIGINVVNDSTVSTQLEEFAKDADYDSWSDLKLAFADKGWTVTWQYGGTDTNITLSADEEFRGTPIWASLIEVLPAGETYTEEEIANAAYCTEDGTKYYNISWGHDVNDEAKDETMTDESKYFYFGSLLEACGYFGVIPKEYLEA